MLNGTKLQVSSSEDAADNEYYYIAVRVNNTDYMNGSPSTNEGWDIYSWGRWNIR